MCNRAILISLTRSGSKIAKPLAPSSLFNGTRSGKVLSPSPANPNTKLRLDPKVKSSNRPGFVDSRVLVGFVPSTVELKTSKADKPVI